MASPAIPMNFDSVHYAEERRRAYKDYDNGLPPIQSLRRSKDAYTISNGTKVRFTARVSSDSICLSTGEGGDASLVVATARLGSDAECQICLGRSELTKSGWAGCTIRDERVEFTVPGPDEERMELVWMRSGEKGGRLSRFLGKQHMQWTLREKDGDGKTLGVFVVDGEKEGEVGTFRWYRGVDREVERTAVVAVVVVLRGMDG